MARSINRARHSRQAMLEQWYAEELPYEEIAKKMGWSPNHPAANYIAVRRARGYHLPPRMDEDLRQTIKEARWG